MKRNATLCNDQTKARPNIMNQVTNRDGRRVRGIWFRNGVYYAQLRVAGNVKQIPLQDAGTVAQAVTARQVLKGQITAGTFPPAPPQPQSPPPPESEALPVAGELDVSDHSIPAAIKTYREERDALKKGDKKTGKRENSGLNKWVEFCNMRQEAKQPKPTHIADLDSKMLKIFAVWRRKKALAELEGKLEEGVTLDAEESGISGRTLDLDVMAIQKVVAWAVTEGWLEVAPVLHWDTLAEEPEKIRLMTSEELESFARANLVTEDSLAGLPKKYRHLRARHARSAQAFFDYTCLIWLSGGREHETLQQRWSNVTWSRLATKDDAGWKIGEKIVGHLHFPGEEAKAGGGKPAEDRNVDFHARLEEHLREMYERRDPTTDWMFPANYDPKAPQGSFRKQLEHARKVTGQEDVGFHHGRHYFISHAVMAGVDFKTIAVWVSHRDGGRLIGRKYSHLSPGHSKLSAQRMDGAF